MNIDLGQLKSILETAKNLQMGNIKDLTTLSGVIQRYNQIAHNNSNTHELPVISPYDENLDLDTFYTSFTTSGASKLTDIITYAEGYIIAHTPIPSTINKIEGWNKTNVIAIMGIIVAALIAIGVLAASLTYQIGCSNGKSETQQGYDAEKNSLSKKIDSLKTKYNIISDSLKLCNANLVEKKDSIGVLISKSKQANNNQKGSVK